MTGHRPDQPGMQNPTDSASQNAGADVSADEFAAALKLIVTRLEGQDDSAESPPQGRDLEDVPTAVPPTGVLNSASDAPRKDALWTGLSDSMPAEPAAAEPEAPSPLAASQGADTAGSGVTSAADLWPASSPAPERQPAAEDPLFAVPSGSDNDAGSSEPPAADSDTIPAADPLFAQGSQKPSASDLLNTPMPDPAPSPDPLFGDTGAQTGDPLFSPSEEAAAGTGGDPLFTADVGGEQPRAASPTEAERAGSDPLFAQKVGDDPFASSDPPSPAKEPLFVDAAGTDALDPPSAPPPSGGTKEPLFVDTAADSVSDDPLTPQAAEPAAPAKEPLFVETPAQDDFDPMAGLRNSDNGPTIGPAMPSLDPLQSHGSAPEPREPDTPADTSSASDPLFVDTAAPTAPTSSETAKEPLFAEMPSPGGPEAPTQPAKEPLFVDTSVTNEPEASPPPAREPLFVDASAPAEPEAAPQPAAKEPLFVDAPTPAEPEGPPQPAAKEPLFVDTSAPVEPDASPPTAKEPLFVDSVTPIDSGVAPDAGQSNPNAGLGGAPDDPFASAAKPAFEDERANALFGDAPDLAAQNAPGSSLGPIGAEAEDFGKGKGLDALSPTVDEPAPGDDANAPDLIATRDLDDDPEGEVALDEILPPLDPAEAASLEKAAGQAQPKRSFNLGTPAFWVLILAILGGISFWGFQQRQQFLAVADWAQARYEMPTGQLMSLFASDPAAEGDIAAAPPPAAMTPQDPPTTLQAEPASRPAVQPESIAAPEPAARPAPVQPQPREPVAVAAATPPQLPADTAPLPSNASPTLRTLAERARSGDALAQHDLANRYATGDGVSPNNANAAFWYGQAAEAGVANAQYNLGVLTTRGLGVPQDHAAAFRLFRGAAEAGHADAQTATGLAYMHGLGVTQDRLQAASWFQAASANGRPRGAYHLGQLFELGLDEAPDLAAAAGWYRIAADAGYDEARVALDRLTAATRAAPSPPPAPSTAAAPATTPTPVPPTPAPVAVEPSELVREIQQLLNQFGYDAGPEDGVLGRKTVDAIRSFERSQGFYVTGEATNGIRDVLKLLANDR